MSPPIQAHRPSNTHPSKLYLHLSPPLPITILHPSHQPVITPPPAETHHPLPINHTSFFPIKASSQQPTYHPPHHPIPIKAPFPQPQRFITCPHIHPISTQSSSSAKHPAHIPTFPLKTHCMYQLLSYHLFLSFHLGAQTASQGKQWFICTSSSSELYAHGHFSR